jgi:hypothetical protein
LQQQHEEYLTPDHRRFRLTPSDPFGR